MDKVLIVAKRLKTFTLEDITMFCEIDANIVEKYLYESKNIKICGNKFEYVETVKQKINSKLLIKILQLKIRTLLL